MSPTALRFCRLEVHRAGERVPTGRGFALHDLAAGVTVVHGPNGSGKSTTALAMQAIFWPQGVPSMRGATVVAELEGEDGRYRVALDAGRVEVHRDGEPTTLEVGPAEHRARYRLALDELLTDTDEGFAAAIARASQGGYDLMAAASAAGFDRSPSAPHGSRKKVRAAQAAVDDATRRQRELQAAEDRLTQLRNDRDEARAALARVDVLQDALVAAGAERKVREVNEELAAFDLAVLGRLKGDEDETLRTLDERIAAQERRLEVARSEAAAAERALADTGLPASGVREDDLLQARAAVKQLLSLRPEVERLREEAAREAGNAASAARRLAPHLSEAQAEALDRLEHPGLEPLLRKAETLRGERAVLDAELGRLQDASDVSELARSFGADALRRGVEALSAFLAQPGAQTAGAAPPRPGSGPVPRFALWLSAATIAVLAVLLAVQESAAWAALLLVAAFAGWHAWRSPASGAQADAAADAEDPATVARVRRQDYRASGLPEPQEWNVTAVQQRLSELQRALAEREALDLRTQMRNDTQRRAERLEAREAELAQERAALRERTGVELELADGAWFLLLQSLATWQAARTRAAGAEAALERKGADLREATERARSVLQRYGSDPGDDPTVVAEAFEDLEARARAHGEAVRARQQAHRHADEAEAERIEAANDRLKLLQAAGLQEGDEPRLQAALEVFGPYRDLFTKLVQNKAIRDERRKQLGEHSQLAERTEAELQLLIAEQQERATHYEALHEQITRTEEQIRVAKDGHDLTDALRELDEARAELATERTANRRKALGAALADLVRREAVDRARPAVFRRADALLARFTGGALRLDLDDRSDPPSFRVRADGGNWRGIDALSVGERIQALTAVRIAFLEQDERYRLPLLLDETLGTTDDERARTVVQAVAELAREGRQVLYFTAQRDEVAKWRAALHGSDVPFVAVDLAAVREGQRAARLPLPEVSAVQDPPPPPAPEANESFRDYGRRLGVPGLDPAHDEVEQVHPYHLLHDPRDLHAVLRHRAGNVERLRNLVELSGPELLPGGARSWRAAQAAARALATAMRLWRKGHGRPVDRWALHDSGCVTDAFLGPVGDLAQELGGDGAALLQALANKSVPRWRSSASECLHDYLSDHGYLPTRDPPTHEELLAVASAEVATELHDGALPHEVVERIARDLAAVPTHRATPTSTEDGT